MKDLTEFFKCQILFIRLTIFHDLYDEFASILSGNKIVATIYITY